MTKKKPPHVTGPDGLVYAGFLYAQAAVDHLKSMETTAELMEVDVHDPHSVMLTCYVHAGAEFVRFGKLDLDKPNAALDLFIYVSEGYVAHRDNLVKRAHEKAETDKTFAKLMEGMEGTE